MVEHRLVSWQPKFDKFVQDYEGDGEWSVSYLQREDVFKKYCDNHYECTCGEKFGTDEEKAKEHVRKEN